MKIAILSPNYPPESGACALRIAHMAQALQTAGHQVEIITVLPNYPQGQIFQAYRKRLFVQETIDRISVRRYPVFASHSPDKLWRVLNLLSIAISTLFSIFFLRKWKPDYLIVQSPPFFLAISGYFLAKFSQSRFVLNLSDLYPEVLADLGVLPKKHFLYKILTQIAFFLYQNAHLLIAQTLEIKKFVYQKNPNLRSILYRTGVDTDHFGLKKTTFSDSTHSLRLVYAGLLGMAQGVWELCQCVDFRALNTELHLYGEGYERRLIKEWLKKNPDKGIFLHPAVAHEQMPTLLSGFDAALVVQKAYLYGTVPAKIYEAVSVGLPVLLLGEGESKELLQKYNLGFWAKPKDYETLIVNILRLKQMPAEKLRTWASHNHAVATEEFDRKKQVEQLFTFF